jgi:hypothetical protein
MAQDTAKRFSSDKGYGFVTPGDVAQHVPFTTPPLRLTATASPGVPARRGDGSYGGRRSRA